MQVVLVMFTGEGDRRSFSIARDTTIIGRRNDCDLCIPVGDVSRKHCRLIKTDDAAKIEDLGSSNGTYVNGQRIHETVLNPGDWIQVGPVQFCVQLDGVPTDEDLASRSAGQSDETNSGHPALEAEAAAGDLSLEDDLTPEGELTPEGSRNGDVYSEASPDSETPVAEVSADELSLDDEVPLEDIPLEESSSDDSAPLDAMELEELPADNAELDDLGLELDEDPSPKPGSKH
jgi:hypothetical protein